MFRTIEDFEKRWAGEKESSLKVMRALTDASLGQMVAPGGRSLGLGSTLLRHYLKLHPAVRRFVLWVDEANQNARDKYSRFGYSPDGLFDHILLSPDIRK